MPDVSVRLVGSENSNEGRVEVFYEGEWGTVCDDYWDITDANVVCRQLGFSGASDVSIEAGFGEGVGATLLDDVQCTGNEERLEDCPSGGWRDENCGHSEDAGVICIGKLQENHQNDNIQTLLMDTLLDTFHSLFFIK